MSAVASVDTGSMPDMRAGDWLVSGALHAAAALALWQLAATGTSMPSAVQRLEVSVRWAVEPQPVPAMPQVPPAAPAADPVPETARTATAATSTNDAPVAHETPAAVPPVRPAAEPRRTLESGAHPAAKPKATTRLTAPIASAEPPAPTAPETASIERRTDPPAVESASPSPSPVAAVETREALPVPASAAPAAVAATPAVADPATMPRAMPSLSSSRASAADPDARRQWRSDLERLMREHKRYPLQARRMRQQGVVTVEARFSPDGELLRCDVADSSGYRSLDEAALELVRTAAALLRSQQVPGVLAELRIPIAFELSGS